MAIGLGSLVVSLAANTAAYERDLGRAAHLAAKRMDEIKLSARNAGTVIASAFAAVTGTLAVVTKQAINNADAMGKMAQSAGMSVESFSALAYAANISNISTETLNTSIARFNRNIIETASGTGDAQRGFEALGIKVRDSTGKLKSQEELLGEVAEKFAVIKDSAGKAAIAQLLFGKSGAQMIPLLNEGRDGIAQLTGQAQTFGQVISKDAAAAADEFNDRLEQLNAVKKGFANQIMIAVLPALNDFAGGLVTSAEKANLMQDAAKQAAQGVKYLVSAGVIVYATFQTVGKSLAIVIGALEALRKGRAREAWNILKEGATDIAGVVTDANTRITRLFDDTARAAEAAAKRTQDAAKRARQTQDAPKVKSNEQIKEAAKLAEERAKAERKAAEEGNAYWVSVGDAMVEGVKVEQEAFANRARFLEAATMTEAEIAQAGFDQRLFDLEEALELGLITQDKYNRLLEDATVAHEERMTDIRLSGLTARQRFMSLSLREQIGEVTGGLMEMTAAAAQHNKTYFEINKAVSTANAIVKGIEAVQSAYAWGSTWGGPAGGAAMAAIAAGATAVQIAAIQATQFGSTTSPSLAGTTAAPPVTPVAAPEVSRSQTTVVHLHGQSFGRDQVRRLLEELNENTRDGGRVVIA